MAPLVAAAWAGACEGQATVEGRESTKAKPCEVTLTSSKQKAACPLPPSLLTRPPLLVEVPVTKIVNPSAMPFSVSVYLNSSKTGTNGRDRELIGNVSVYPPDRTGVFVMRSKQAFERLQTSHTSRRGNEIMIEIRRAYELQPWQPITVSIGPLRWLYEEPKP
jgi:hypothetical protein